MLKGCTIFGIVPPWKEQEAVGQVHRIIRLEKSPFPKQVLNNTVGFDENRYYLKSLKKRKRKDGYA